jgi:hypothetical protein
MWIDDEKYMHCEFAPGDVTGQGRFGFTSYSGLGSSTVHDFTTYTPDGIPPVYLPPFTNSLPLSLYQGDIYTKWIGNGTLTVRPADKFLSDSHAFSNF